MLLCHCSPWTEQNRKFKCRSVTSVGQYLSIPRPIYVDIQWKHWVVSDLLPVTVCASFPSADKSTPVDEPLSRVFHWFLHPTVIQLRKSQGVQTGNLPHTDTPTATSHQGVPQHEKLCETTNRCHILPYFNEFTLGLFMNQCREKHDCQHRLEGK